MILKVLSRFPRLHGLVNVLSMLESTAIEAIKSTDIAPVVPVWLDTIFLQGDLAYDYLDSRLGIVARESIFFGVENPSSLVSI